MKKLLTTTFFVIFVLGYTLLTGCDPVPPLNLHYGQVINTELPMVELNIDVMWDYDLSYVFGYDTTYDWRREWKYGWDKQDESMFGEIGYKKPKSYNIRRYYHAFDTVLTRHTEVLRNHVDGHSFSAQYQFGYYDLLIWNDPVLSDGVYSLVFDEETTLDSVMVTTNASGYASRYHAPSKMYAYNQPDELFSGEMRNFYISPNYEDYDHYDNKTHVYYKYLNVHLYPVTYIYLTQVILHNNYGKIVGTEGKANFSNFAYATCLNSGRASKDPVTVHYNNRLKKDVYLPETDETVDIVGGRLISFGICGINPFLYDNPQEMPESAKLNRHYMDVTLLFGNGYDSTLVFDVTDQVLKCFRGGIITVDLSMDTINSPKRAGGSGFDAVVEDWVEETHEISF